ncbi:putative cytokinetic ring protein SteA [uncultured Varibaculum sp.]|uniref:putative cytokinetic ring protein SteA n=2 Tax=uncultured Varibaculum sp. TaxID=413896 RepID=UPI00258CB3D5|nr:putative cytokinetic ring protein SteA [uncultured Varibaculum sp.]
MGLFRRSKTKAAEPASSCRVRVDKKTKHLTQRLQAGEIAVINHADIDRIAAETLVAAAPSAVLNAAKSTTGRYPNMGPSIIVDAGITLIDDLGSGIMNLKEGSTVTIEGNAVYQKGELLAEGVLQTPGTIATDLEEARKGVSTQIEAFAANTMEYLRRERDLLLDGVGVPKVETKFAGKHALIVVRGYHYQEDLRSLRPYIREYKPVLVGVDGGADAILEQGYTPDMIIGDMDSVSDQALRCGAEIVVHAYRNGKAPGTERLKREGIPHVLFPATGTSEDVAMLLADDKGAEMIVALGTHATLVEFLDKGRSGMASTFLTRLRVGSKLVDAKGVSQLYQPRISTWQTLLLALVGVGAVAISLAVTPVGQTFYGIAGIYLNDLIDFFRQLFGVVPSLKG